MNVLGLVTWVCVCAVGMDYGCLSCVGCACIRLFDVCLMCVYDVLDMCLICV